MHSYRHWTVRLCLGVGAAAVFGSAYWHQVHADGQDFLAYYKAAHRYLHANPFYVFEGGYAFKYAPVSVFYFLPFAFLDYDTARWVYASLHALAAVAIPVLLWVLIRRDPFWSARVSVSRFVTALGVGFVASFRFVDGELRSNNVGLFVTFAILAGVWALTRPRVRRFAPLIIGLGAVVKVHPMIAWLAFRFWEKRTFWALLVASAVLLLIPDPRYWWDWVIQMRSTQGVMPLSPGNYNLQGFQSFGERFFGWDPHGSKSLFLAAPFFLAALVGMPRFSLEQGARRPVHFMLTSGGWVLLALMCSPLPWQHTYSILWALWPLSWIVATPAQSKLLLVLAFLLGFSPRDIAGPVVFAWLEGNQSVFLLILVFWLLLFHQARSLKENS